MATAGPPLESIPLKAVFYDAHERREYLRAVEIARSILGTPSLIKDGAAFLERHVRPDPHQARAYALWAKVIQLAPIEIAKELLADTSLGAELRSTAPVFVVLASTPQRALG